jgi:hypothetical protein
MVVEDAKYMAQFVFVCVVLLLLSFFAFMTQPSSQGRPEATADVAGEFQAILGQTEERKCATVVCGTLQVGQTCTLHVQTAS